MPRAEKNQSVQGQPYGEATRQADFVSATDVPDAAAPVQGQDLFQPDATSPVDSAPFSFDETHDLPAPSDQLVFGAPLSPDEAGAMFAPAAPSLPEDADPEWLPILQDVSTQPGASEGIKRLTEALQQRYGL